MMAPEGTGTESQGSPGQDAAMFGARRLFATIWLRRNTLSLAQARAANGACF